MKYTKVENTSESCEQSCEIVFPCVGWVYHQINKTCNLFNKLDQLYPFNGTSFGLKNCSNQLIEQLISGITDHFLVNNS